MRTILFWQMEIFLLLRTRCLIQCDMLSNLRIAVWVKNSPILNESTRYLGNWMYALGEFAIRLIYGSLWHFQPLPLLHLVLSFAFYFFFFWFDCFNFNFLETADGFSFFFKGNVPPQPPKKIITIKYFSLVFLNTSYQFTEWFWNSHSPVSQSVNQIISFLYCTFNDAQVAFQRKSY